MNLQNKATRTIGPEGNERESATECKVSMDSGKGKEVGGTVPASCRPRQQKFVSSLLPSPNRTLCDKITAPLHMQLRQRRLRSGSWERQRCVEKAGSNRSNVEEEGSRAENNYGQNGQPKRSRPKSKSRRALERTQSQRFNVI